MDNRVFVARRKLNNVPVKGAELAHSALLVRLNGNYYLV